MRYRGADPQVALGYVLMRDGNGPRALDILARYRGSILAELFRSLAALEARQARAQSPTAAPGLLDPRRAETKRIPGRKPNKGLAVAQSTNRHLEAVLPMPTKLG
jgi:hypothetical protein